MYGSIIKGGKIYVAVLAGDTKVSTDKVIYIQVPVGKTLKDVVDAL